MQFVGGGGGGAHGSLGVPAPAVIWTPHQLPYELVVTPFAVVPVKLVKLPTSVTVIEPVCPLAIIPACKAAIPILLSVVYGLLPQILPPLVLPVTVNTVTFPVQQLKDSLIIKRKLNKDTKTLT